MKKSKLLKVITLPTLATVIGVAPLTLCQCGNGKTDPVTPSVDPSVSETVDITTTTDSAGNSVSTLTPKSSSSQITDVSVSIGSTTLTKDTEYSVSGLTTSNGSVVVTIFKATLSKYSGSIVIKPSVKSYEPTIDSSALTKVSISSKIDDSGNGVSTLTPKSGYKITDISSIIIGSTTLVKDTDYKVSGLSTNGSSVTITIFKVTLNKYTGNIVIKPSVEVEPVVWTSVSCSPSSISKEVNGTVKSGDITVYAVYSDGSKTQLTWNTGYKVYKGSEEQTDFGTGITFTTKGTYSFTIKAVEDTTKTTTLTVNVTLPQATITFVPVGGTLSSTSVKVDKGSLWSSVTKPTTTASYGYNNTVTWRNGSATGEEMQASTPISSNMTIYACFEERPTASGGTKVFDTYNEAFWDSYIPLENSSDTGTYKVQRVAYNNDSQYTFKITLDGSTITNVRYFWIYQITGSGSTGRLFPVQTNSKNLVSVKDGDGNDLGYSIQTASNGKYIALSKTYTSGTIAITIQFHEDDYIPLNFIPAFEKAN